MRRTLQGRPHQPRAVPSRPQPGADPPSSAGLDLCALARMLTGPCSPGQDRSGCPRCSAPLWPAQPARRPTPALLLPGASGPIRAFILP